MKLANMCAIILTIFIALNFWPNYSFAAEMQAKYFPVGCRNMGYSFRNDKLVLAPTTTESGQTLYLFHNISNSAIQFKFQRDPQDITSVQFETTISPDRWVSFAMDKKEMVFDCNIIYANNEYAMTSCKSGLDVCQYNHAKFAEHNEGTYWVSQNKSLQEVLHESIRKVGILLRS